jgi:hypothetical protein
VEHRSFHSLHHKLGNPVATPEAHLCAGIGIEQGYPYLATVPGVYGARCIHDRDAVARYG